jgi:hypothetical protein
MEHFQLEEQDLLKRVEQLRAKAAEIKKNNEENKISQQRDLITENFRKFTEMCDLSEESIWAYINSVFPYQQYKKYLQGDPKVGQSCSHRQQTHLNIAHLNVGFYTKASDRNILLERKLINHFATYNGIRFEDSKDVLFGFITDIRPINLNGDQYVTSDFVPLFF